MVDIQHNSIRARFYFVACALEVLLPFSRLLVEAESEAAKISIEYVLHKLA